MATTWNSLDKSAGLALSGGDLTTTGSDGGSVRATNGVSSGKWYWEITVGTPAERDFGIALAAHTISNYTGGDANSYGYYGGDGKIYSAPFNAAYGATFTTGDVIGIALDMDNGKVFFSKNGVYQASGDPVAGTNAAFTGLSGSMYPCVGGGDNGVATTNFGATAFATAPPTGYSAYDTAILPTTSVELTQLAIEVVNDGEPFTELTQLAIEALTDAEANLMLTQLCIELVVSRNVTPPGPTDVFTDWTSTTPIYSECL